MKPWETIQELQERIKDLEMGLLEGREARYKIRGNATYEWTPLEDRHFAMFEESINKEIEMIKFHIDLEKLLSGN